MRKKIIKTAVLFLIIVLMIITRVLVGSYSEHKRGEEFFQNADLGKALIHFDRAVHWYTPLNPFVKRSVERMYEIGRIHESNEERGKAVDAYEVLRSAIYSTRSFYTPYKDVIDRTDQKIASLRSLNGSGKGKGPGREEILKDLKKDRAPDVFFSILSILGFLGWVASALYFILAVMDKDVFPRRKAFVVGLLFFVFYVAWVLGLAGA